MLGNLGGGAGVLTLPHTTNFDVTLTKVIPILGSEKRVLKLQVQAYNVFNHTEISGVNSAIQFNPANNAVSNPTGVGYGTAAFPNRILAFTARFLSLLSVFVHFCRPRGAGDQVACLLQLLNLTGCLHSLSVSIPKRLHLEFDHQIKLRNQMHHSRPLASWPLTPSRRKLLELCPAALCFS